MKTRALALGLGAATLLSLGACDNNANNNGSKDAPKAQTKEAEKAAGSKTIAAGLDQTLAGAGPYTVFVPDDAAFGNDQSGALAATPENRPQLTGVITNLILQGTVMAEDVGKLTDRDQGEREDRPDRCRRAQGIDHQGRRALFERRSTASTRC